MIDNLHYRFSMTLFKADRNFFVDLDTLKTVRFEESENEEVTAHLHFKDGGTETIQGEAAGNLHRQLGGFDESAPKATPASLVEQDPFTGPSPTSDLDGTHFSRLTELLGRSNNKKAWFYRKDGNGRRLILAFVNAKGSCSVRPFDGDQNIAFGKKYGPGDYQKYFGDLVKGAWVLTVDAQPNLERDCKDRLPERTFEYLRKQIERIDRK